MALLTCVIGETSPSSRLNETFLRTSKSGQRRLKRMARARTRGSGIQFLQLRHLREAQR